MKTTMPAPLALYLIDAMLAAIPTDDITPVLKAARLDRVGRKLRATATDRYRIHEVTLDAAPTTSAKGEGVTVPAAMLTRIKRSIMMLAPRRADRAETVVTIQTRHDGSSAVPRKLITATITDAAGHGLTISDHAEPGNYPPVTKLIDQAADAGRYTGDVILNAARLAKLRPLAPEWPSTIRFKHTAARTSINGETPVENPERPGPVLAIADETEGILARAVIMPNLERRR